MAPMTMHPVIGEPVFPEIPHLELSPPMYGAFLLGNLLVDVHAFSDINRAATHFAKRMESTGPYAITRSCANFLGRLDRLLVRPGGELTSAEQAFVAGHLCHLAADEDWKQFDWDLLQTLGPTFPARSFKICGTSRAYTSRARARLIRSSPCFSAWGKPALR